MPGAPNVGLNTYSIINGWYHCTKLADVKYLFVLFKDFTFCPLHIELMGDQQPSPFKEVDDFVLTVVCKDGIQGCKQK